MSMFKVLKHSRERVFTLYCLYNTRRRIARAPHRCSPFDVRRLEKIDTPISEWYIARWWGFSFADGLQFLDCWFFFSSPVSFSRFVLNVIQLFAPIIFTWFSLIFNDSCVFILFKSLPYCKRVFSQVFLRWTELNYCDYHQCNGTSRRCYCLYSFLSNESLQSGNAVSVQSTERNQFSVYRKITLLSEQLVHFTFLRWCPLI